MAAGAAHSGIDREAGIEVQLATELDLGAGERVGIEAGDLTGPLRETQRQDRLKDRRVLCIGEPAVDLLGCNRPAARDTGSQGRLAEDRRLGGGRSGGDACHEEPPEEAFDKPRAPAGRDQKRKQQTHTRLLGEGCGSSGLPPAEATAPELSFPST